VHIRNALEGSLRNLRHAVRALAKTPAFTTTVIFTLALGIGANSAVFSAINAVLLRPLPFPHADRLVILTQTGPKHPQPFIAPVRLEEWNRLNESFEAITGYYSQDESELSGDLPEKMTRAFVAARFQQVWGVAPEIGRGFLEQEEHFGGPNAVLISHRLWMRRFGGDPSAVGRTLRIGKSAVPIVGVLPASFAFPDRNVDLWSRSPADAPFARNREQTWYTGTGRLKPGITLEQARANLSSVQAALGRQFPKPDADLRPALAPLKEVTIGGVRQTLWILFGSVSLLLLIACTNIAALLLSRASRRQQEISVRFSLGATKSAIAAQLLTEVLVLALAGAGLGLVVATASARLFRSFATSLPRVEEIALDWRIVLYTFACAIFATLLCGILPAIRATRRSLAGSMAQGSRSQVSGHNPLQFALVGIQVALAVTLLSGAGLLLRSLQELGRVSPGFDPQNVLTFHISSTWAEAGNSNATYQRVQRILDVLRVTPGVTSAAVSVSLPGVTTGTPIEVVTAEGRAPSAPKMMADSRAVTGEYFATMRIPLLEGEVCRSAPNISEVMINRAFATAYLDGSKALGHHLTQPGNSYIQPSEIRGIVGDAREGGLEKTPLPTVYWCYGGLQPGTYFIARTQGDPNAMIETLRRKVHEVEPARSVYGMVPLTSQISDTYAENRLRTILLAFFAATAVLLACVGLYGTLSYLVSIRQREIGLRLALGALPPQIARQFLAQGLRTALIGCAAGVGMAIAMARLIAGMLFGVSPSDPLTLGAVVALVATVSIAASLLPAIRASRLDPMDVLRES
jgi:putative ABC transport system permease protein